MEHIVALLALHGFDDIVVTVAFLANQIRDYFGDGSDFGVRMRYATEDSPLGTAGSVRNASHELDETFLVISGDVLTDIDLTAFVKAHRDASASASIALKHVDNPLEFGIVITQADGTDRALPREADRGARCSPTRSTPASTCSSPTCSTSSPRARSSTSRATCSPRCSKPGTRCTATSSTATGKTSARSRRTSACTPDVLDGHVRVDIDGFRLGEGRVDRHGRRDRARRPGSTGPVVIGDNCRVEAGAHLREYTVLGTDVVVKADAFLERAVCHDHVYVGPADEPARLRDRAQQRPARARARRRRRRRRRRVLRRRRTRSINPSVKIYPFKTVEAGAVVTSSIVWESRGARDALRAAWRARPRQRRHHAPRSRRASRWRTAPRCQKGSVVSTSRDTSRLARALKRGAHRRPQPLRHQRGGHRARDRAAHPVPGAQRPVAGRHHGAARRRTTPTPSRSGSSTATAATSTRRSSARSSGCSTARTSGARSPATSATSSFPPRSLEFYTAALEQAVDTDRLRERAFKVVLDYSYGAASIVMPNRAREARAPRCWR